MAEVWLATDTALSRQVAVKVLKPVLAADPVVAERFRREAIAVAGLSHPNIVAVHDTIEENGRQAVVMQLVNGKSLRQLLDEQKRLSPELTMHIGTCVASALDAAHRANLVHRDVKPGNILVTPDGRVLLTDFGIAKGVSASDDLTSDNVMMGTAKYLSPEQVRGRKLDGRADLYSLGLVLYECLAGRVPFLGETDADTALARLQRDPTDLARLRPTLPYGLAPLIHRLLSRNPEDRPATGAELRAALARLGSGADDPTTTLTPPRGAQNPGAERNRSVTPTRGSPRGFTPAPSRTPSGSPRPRAPGPTAGPGAAVPAHPTIPGQPRVPTPSSGIARGRPSRQDQQRWGPSLVVVGGLLLLALIVALLLWVGLDDEGAQPGALADAAAATTVAPATTLGGPALLETITSFDPGDRATGRENDDQVGLVRDGNPSTVWATECYSNKYMGAKQGVGLVLTFDRPALGQVGVSIASAPYQLEVYATSEAAVPGSIEAWGAPVAPKFAATVARAITATIDGEPARHVLVLFRELGAGGAACGDAHPYKGRIAEITFTPAA